MNGYDILLTIIILLVFIFLFLAPMFSVGIQNIKENWVEYRCNPMVLPFAGLFGENPSTTFTYCIQSMLKDFMKIMMIPLQQAIKVIQTIGGGFETAINDVRKILSAVRSLATSIIQTIFGVVLNILVEIQKLMIKLKDLVSKIIGIMTTLLFMVYGSMQAMQSAWNGPPGQLARALCFRATTKMELYDGTIREIKDLEVGDILRDGAIVEGVLKLHNNTRSSYFKLSGGTNNEDIYVTGSHMINDGNNNYIPVSKHLESQITNEQDDVVYSLMTSNNKIVIGNREFWDWDDDEIVLKYKFRGDI